MNYNETDAEMSRLNNAIKEHLSPSGKTTSGPGDKSHKTSTLLPAVKDEVTVTVNVTTTTAPLQSHFPSNASSEGPSDQNEPPTMPPPVARIAVTLKAIAPLAKLRYSH